jgi:hypothetical protein
MHFRGVVHPLILNILDPVYVKTRGFDNSDDLSLF